MKLRNMMLFTNKLFRYNFVNKHFRTLHHVHNTGIYTFQYNIMEKYGYICKMNRNENLSSSGLNSSKDNFDTFIKDWSKETPQALYQTFVNLVQYCIENNQSMSDKRLDNFIDNLTDNIKYATEYELKSIFSTLAKFSGIISLRARNYAEIFAALDEECLDRINTMTFDDKLMYITLFYNCSIMKQSDFCYKCLMNFFHKENFLTKAQFVQFMFYIGFLKHIPEYGNIHKLETSFKHFFSELDTNELAIITMGLCNNNAPICSRDLIEMIIDKIIKTCDDIHDLSLGALIRIIKYSIMNISYFDNKLYQLLDCLQFQIPKLSIATNTDIATLAATTRIVHKACLMNIAEHTLKNISSASLKDLSKLVKAFGVLNISLLTKDCFLTNIVEEMKKYTTENEITKWGRNLASCVANLGLLEIYPYDLMKYILNKEFLETVYGKNCKMYGSDILTIHNLSKIFYKKNNISSLHDKQAQNLSHMCLKHQFHLKKVDKNFLDIKHTLAHICGGNEFVTEKHILTHDINGIKYLILCNDHKDVPLPVYNGFAAYKLGMIYYPPDNNMWIVLIIAHKNNILKNLDTYTGDLIARKRELIKLGYFTAIVRRDVYEQCQNQDEKVKYLNTIIDDAFTSK